jgi:proteasome lid subunit RPN8/RPN11
VILQIQQQQLDSLRIEAGKSQPVEACSILFGRIIEEKAHIHKIVHAKNILSSNSRFEIDPEYFLKELNDAEKEGLEFIGLFHSHPALTHPSSIDQKYMKLWGKAIWLILSMKKNVIRAFQMIDGNVREIPILID